MRLLRPAALNWFGAGGGRRPVRPRPRAGLRRRGLEPGQRALGEAPRARGVGRAGRDTGPAPWGGGAVNSSLMLATAWAYGSRGRPATCPVFVNRGPRCLALEGQPPCEQHPGPQGLHRLPRSFARPGFASSFYPQRRPSLLGQTSAPECPGPAPPPPPGPESAPSVQRGNWVPGGLPVRPSCVSTP